ncbi:MAG: PhoH family protein [Erysipelotrichaceae bacterium]
MDNLVIDLSDYNYQQYQILFKNDDFYINEIAAYYDTELSFNDGKFFCSDNAKVSIIKKVIEKIISEEDLSDRDFYAILNDNFYKELIFTGNSLKKIYLRTYGQKKLYDSFKSNVITFVTGPAGSGKTFLTVVYSYNLLKKGQIKKIVITRPVVESGESLGFLPGDLQQKVDPYLRPIYDSFETLVGSEYLTRLIEKGIIEIAPLAYMRGRTLNDACIILDEGQNATVMQMKMFLTRLGFNSKMIITGDITQIDLPATKKSGLIDAINTVKGIDDIGIVNMESKDVVRHQIVSKIIDAYQNK